MPGPNSDENARGLNDGSQPEPENSALAVDSTKLSFLDLPLNVRCKIYRYACVPGKILVKPYLFLSISQNPYYTEHSANCGPVNFALMKTCKKIHDEIVPILYSENILIFIHPDAFQSIMSTNANFSKYFKHIRKVEIVFDYRYLRDIENDFRTEIDYAKLYIQSTPVRSVALRRSLIRVQELYDDISGISEACDESGGKAPPLSAAEANHKILMRNLRKFLWGHTLSFIRRHMLLTHLHLDFRMCYCCQGCCRLPTTAIRWGNVRFWVHGLPKFVTIAGVSPDEEKAIRDAINKQGPTYENTKDASWLLNIADSMDETYCNTRTSLRCLAISYLQNM
ncbi:hypothetical protein AJ79_01001 [Helicocarpus griseus UAMH5409]|uniref:F-box domain-containing protein n=1 Tax=Helicocarpus griseus UAMH5409 TaxID=1447875 RepID=A0A2B7Y972_9EURO|nr:hypothetical protein AJ79_01001 [Helicocarpus griseus UAMH5409]